MGASPPLTPHKTTLLWTDEYMTQYVKKLTETLRKFHLQVSSTQPPGTYSSISNEQICTNQSVFVS